MSFGSQRGFAYTTDEGDVYSLRLDESNTELINGSDAPAPAANVDALAMDIRRRYVVLEASNGSTKKVVVLSRAIFDTITIGQTFAAPAVGEENPASTAFTVVRKVPERIFRRVTSLDTGKIDGDQP